MQTLVLVGIGVMIAVDASLAATWYWRRKLNRIVTELEMDESVKVIEVAVEPALLPEYVVRKSLKIRSKQPELVKRFVEGNVTLILSPGEIDYVIDDRLRRGPTRGSRNKAHQEEQEAEELAKVHPFEVENVQPIEVRDLLRLAELMHGTTKRLFKKETVN